MRPLGVALRPGRTHRRAIPGAAWHLTILVRSPSRIMPASTLWRFQSTVVYLDAHFVCTSHDNDVAAHVAGSPRPPHPLPPPLSCRGSLPLSLILTYSPSPPLLLTHSLSPPPLSTSNGHRRR